MVAAISSRPIRRSWQGAGVEPLPDLPPKVPETLPELERVLQPLNAVCQAGKIKDKHRIELEDLVGCRVTQQLAALWRKHLGEICRDLAAELKSNPEGSCRGFCRAVAGAQIRIT
jgi:hypothetical protein